MRKTRKLAIFFGIVLFFPGGRSLLPNPLTQKHTFMTRASKIQVEHIAKKCMWHGKLTYENHNGQTQVTFTHGIKDDESSNFTWTWTPLFIGLPALYWEYMLDDEVEMCMNSVEKELQNFL